MFFFYVFLHVATVQLEQIQQNKFPLSFNSLKCLPQAKKLFEKQRWEKSLVLQTNSAHKRLQLNQSALGKSYYCYFRGQIYAQISKNPMCFALRSRRRGNFSKAWYFLKLVWQIGKDRKGYKRQSGWEMITNENHFVNFTGATFD